MAIRFVFLSGNASNSSFTKVHVESLKIWVSQSFFLVSFLSQDISRGFHSSIHTTFIYTRYEFKATSLWGRVKNYK